MARCSMLLLAAAAIAGGCSRDAPLVAPQVEAVDAIAAPSLAVASSVVDAHVDAIDDAVGRLVPALGEHGSALRTMLLKVKANSRGDQASRNELDGVLELLASTLPPRYSADLDALRLELGVATKLTPTTTHERIRHD